MPQDNPLPAATTTINDVRDALRVKRALGRVHLRDVGKIVGCAASTLSRFENGADLSLPHFLAVAHWCGYRLVLD